MPASVVGYVFPNIYFDGADTLYIVGVDDACDDDLLGLSANADFDLADMLSSSSFRMSEFILQPDASARRAYKLL